MALGFDVATVDAGAHILHDSGSRTAVYKDAAELLVHVAMCKREQLK